MKTTHGRNDSHQSMFPNQFSGHHCFSVRKQTSVREIKHSGVQSETGWKKMLQVPFSVILLWNFCAKVPKKILVHLWCHANMTSNNLTSGISVSFSVSVPSFTFIMFPLLEPNGNLR